jgi:hypothetical protein
MGLTLNEERNVDPPYASRDGHNNPLSFPNGDAGGSYKLRRFAESATEEDAHAEHDQQRRRSQGHVR